MSRKLLIFVFSGIFSLPLFSQQKTGREEKVVPLRTFAVISVGRVSDAQWRGNGPDQKVIALDPGATPPPTLFYRSREGKTERLSLFLNGIGRPGILGRETLHLLWEEPGGENAAGKSFARIKVPARPGHYDIILWRNNKAKDWKDCEKLVVPSTLKSFPPNSVRLLNINPRPVRFQFGEKVIDVRANSGRIIRLDEGEAGRHLRIRAGYRDKNRWVFVMRSTVRFRDKQRLSFIIYPSRTKGRLCEVARFVQPLPPVLRKKGKETVIDR